jgi:hypothetical protein
MSFVISTATATVFSIMLILSVELVTMMIPSEGLAAEEKYATTTTTINQLPTQSNTANGDDNRLQNCAQTAAVEQNDQSLDCQQNSIQTDTEDTREIAILTVIKEVECIGTIILPQPSPLSLSPESNNQLVSSANNNSMSANQQVVFPPISLPPSSTTCPSPSPSAFTIHVEGNNPSPSSFPGSSVGTTVILGEGEYSVTETTPTPPSGREIIGHLSPDCSGSISLGESKTCIITNEVRVVDGTLCPIGYIRNSLGICVPI